MAKNILSIGHFTCDYPYNCEFYGIGFAIKEWETNYVLMSRHRKGNLYTLFAPYEAYFSTHFWTASNELWHQCFRHPQASIVQVYKSDRLIIRISSSNNSHLFVKIVS